VSRAVLEGGYLEPWCHSAHSRLDLVRLGVEARDDAFVLEIEQLVDEAAIVLS
jgi:hypothetical protein